MARRLSLLTHLLRSLMTVPAVADPPRRVARDWWFAGAIVAAAAIEGVARPDLTWRPVAVVAIVLLSLTVLWRRTHPLAMTAAAFGTVVSLDVAAQISTGQPIEIYSSAFVLVFPYVLARWASGRDALLGLAITAVPLVKGLAEGLESVGDSIGGALVLLLPAAIGVEVRHFVGGRERTIDKVKERERQLLARDLHDTVAHHVSAIAVQAQAGRVVGANRPEAALDALAVIEESASRTLAEMRGIVGALRGADDASFAPQPGVADIHALASSIDDPTPVVHVSTSGMLDQVGASIGAAAYRITQEAVTNARRHATDATRIDVVVSATEASVSVNVTDDGNVPFDTVSNGFGSDGLGSDGFGSNGFGIVGMTERAHLLGGTLRAGPRTAGGWETAATIPFDGAIR